MVGKHGTAWTHISSSCSCSLLKFQARRDQDIRRNETFILELSQLSGHFSERAVDHRTFCGFDRSDCGVFDSSFSVRVSNLYGTTLHHRQHWDMTDNQEIRFIPATVYALHLWFRWLIFVPTVIGTTIQSKNCCSGKSFASELQRNRVCSYPTLMHIQSFDRISATSTGLL